MAKRRRESDIFDLESDSFLGYDPYEISIPASKRRTLSSLDASNISGSFSPTLRSTLRSGIIEFPLPPVVLPEVILPENPIEEHEPTSDSLSNIREWEEILQLSLVSSDEESTAEVSTVEDSVPLETPVVEPHNSLEDFSLGYNETAAASNGRTSALVTPYVDPIPPCEVLPVDITPRFVLCRASSQRGGNHIVLEPHGYKYTSESKPEKSTGRLLWACSCKRKGCRARIDTPVEYDDLTESDERRVKLDVNLRNCGTLSAVQSHNCQPKKNLYEQLVLYRETKKTGRAQPDTGAFSIVNAAINNLDTNVDKEGFRSLQNQARVVENARKEFKSIQPNKDNVATFAIDPTNPSVTNFVRASVVTENKKRGGEIESHRSIFCCTDEQFAILKQIEEMRVDGTFKLVGSPFYQLVSLHAHVLHGHQRKSMPIGYIIMSGKTQADYTDIFKKIKELVEEDGTRWNLVNVMLDFEIALRNSLKTVWPNVRLSGCWFHYCQAIWRKVQKFGLEPIYYDELGAKYIKRIMILPLFHANDDMILRVFNAIRLQFEKEKDSFTPEIVAAFEKFFNYVDSQWISNPKIPTSELSVFDTPVRTNNTSENWNGNMWRKAGNKSKPFYKLLRFLQTQRKANISIYALQAPRRNIQQKKKDKDIQEIWDEMKAKTLQIPSAMSRLTKVVFREKSGFQYDQHMMLYTCDDIDEDNE